MGAGREMEFKICYFKLKISHDGKRYDFPFKILSEAEPAAGVEWTRLAGLAEASPPTPKAEFNVYFQNFSLE